MCIRDRPAVGPSRPLALPPTPKVAAPPANAEAQATRKAMDTASGGAASRGVAAPIGRASPSAVPKVGRNDDCPCGSGKKYKKCHGASAA